MAFCLPKNLSETLNQKILSGEINLDTLREMENSADRRAVFAEVVGEENAKHINTLFESKIVLANFQKGAIKWIEEINGLKPEIRNDMIAKVERLNTVLSRQEQDVFFQDLAERRLGMKLTQDEYKAIVEMTKEIQTARKKVDRSSENGSESRLKYGKKLVAYRKIVSDKLIEAKGKKTITEKILDAPFFVGDVARSVVASADNSFWLRQGLPILMNDPKSWTKGFMESWKNMGSALAGGDPLDLVQADVFSSENAMNGMYKKMGIAIGIEHEEEIPSALVQRIPILGRVFKASEAAYAGGALRLRQLYADTLIRTAERNGINLNDSKQMKDLGRLVNTMTGRGTISGLSGEALRKANAVFFSPRYVKSQIDMLTMPFKRGVDPAVRKIAAMNLLRTIVGIAAMLSLSKLFDEDSVDFDPRSSEFGKIKVGDTRFNISAGMGSVITLASRLTPSFNNGELGFWNKSSKGKWTNLTAGKYGQRNVTDVLYSFIEGKLSPAASVIKDVWKGETFDFEKPTLAGEAQGLLTPIPFQTYQELVNNPDSAPVLASMIMETLGVGVNTYSK